MRLTPGFMHRAATLALLAFLAGCGGRSTTSNDGDPRYPGLSCVPFARAVTGVDLHGDAADWWTRADGRYARLHSPRVGSILVLARGPRLPSGHVAVVSRLGGPRQIQVVQANWVPGELARDQPVLDVSAAGDWSLVRMWYPPIRAMGSHAYRALGFVVPDRPLGHDALTERAPRAAETAEGS